jgi:hypothetical protein
MHSTKSPNPAASLENEEAIAREAADKLSEWLFMHFTGTQINMDELTKFFLTALKRARQQPAYYCQEHRYNPPENSGFSFCPQCEFPSLEKVGQQPAQKESVEARLLQEFADYLPLRLGGLPDDEAAEVTKIATEVLRDCLATASSQPAQKPQEPWTFIELPRRDSDGGRYAELSTGTIVPLVVASQICADANEAIANASTRSPDQKGE